jgi:hypothetical protein
MARRCPTCRHEPFTVAGRCVVPTGTNTVCGCTCAARPSRGRTPTLQTGPVLEAVRAGHHWGYRIVEVTGMSETTVYSALRQLADDRLIEAVPGGEPAPPHRVEYRPVSVDLVR